MSFWSRLTRSTSDDGPTALVTGVPRSGTTLACHLLNRLPDVLALHEPLDMLSFEEARDDGALRRVIERFARRTRRSVRERGVAQSVHVAGAVPDNHMAEQQAPEGLRASLAEKGEILVDRELAEGWLLVLKHPTIFTARLAALRAAFPVVAIIRNPLATLASWNSVDLPVQRGHVPAGERLDPDLARDLAAIDDVLDRQIHILEWFLGRFARFLPPEDVLRYEDVVAEGGRPLACIAPSAATLDVPLSSRNRSPLYDVDLRERIATRVLATRGPIWDFFTRAEVEAAGGEPA